MPSHAPSSPLPHGECGRPEVTTPTQPDAARRRGLARWRSAPPLPPAPPAQPGHAGLRPERHDLRPEHADEPDPGRGRRDRRPAGRQRDGHRSATRCCSSRAPTARAAAAARSSRSATTPRSPASARRPTDVTINGHVDVYNRCLTAGQLHRAGQLLALAVEPDHQRHGADGCRALGRLLGRLAGRADAPGQRHRRQPDADGLLHRRSAVRERRLHRRLADRLRHQRLAAAVPRARQQHRRLVERRLEPGLLRRRRARRRSRFPTTPSTRPVHHAGDQPGDPGEAVPVRRRAGSYSVFVPALRANSAGTTWAGGPTPGTSIPIDELLRRRPGRLASRRSTTRSPAGENLIFTPGVYHARPDDQGQAAGHRRARPRLPTLVPRRRRRRDDASPTSTGVDARRPDDRRRPGELAGAAAGRHQQPAHNRSDAADPIALQRRLLPHRRRRTPGKATTSLVVNSDDVILDDIWAWRADHGNGVGWTVNTADTGVIVNGDDVTAYGLFVEHYQRYEVIWNGESGRTIFFQNEMPYDPPSQAAWIARRRQRLRGLQGGRLGEDARGAGASAATASSTSTRRSTPTRAFEVPVRAGREAARPADRVAQRRRHHRPRRQRHRRAGGRLESGDERRRLPVR